MARRTISDHLTRVESYIALGQWIWDRWPLVLALLGGGVMTYLSLATQWIIDAGPAVVGGVAIASALAIYLVLRLGQYLGAVKRHRDTERLLADRVAAQNPNINPAEKHFKAQRIDLHLIANPMTGQIIGKRFDDCEIFGPATVYLNGGTIFGASFENLNLIAIRPDRPVWKRNIIELVNCEIRGGLISHLNIVGYPDVLAPIVLDIGAHLLSFSGDDELDAVEPTLPKGAVPHHQANRGTL